VLVGGTRVETDLFQVPPSDAAALAQVADRGVGFDPAATNHGLGIISMTERLNLVGGEIRIESCPGAGTTVRVRVPLHLERQAETPHALA